MPSSSLDVKTFGLRRAILVNELKKTLLFFKKARDIFKLLGFYETLFA
jgi:hypothetical protein